MSAPASTIVTTTSSTTGSGSTISESTSNSVEIYSRPTSSTQPPITTLTTPFVQASNCISVWKYTTRDFYSYPRVVEDRTDPHQKSCRPSGWASRALSPAVCPESWTYYGISASGVGYGTETAPNTVATCCPSGYAPEDEYKYFDQGSLGSCTSWTKPHKSNTPLTATGEDNQTTLFSGKGYIIQAAWTIKWAPSDVDRLSPKPPSVTASYGAVIPTWVPGGKVKQVSLQYVDDSGLQALNQLFLAGVIGGPLAFVLICICCCICCRRRRKRKAEIRAWHENQAIEMEAAQRST